MGLGEMGEHPPAMGYWGTCPFPSTFNCLIFLVTSEPHKLWHRTLYGCIPPKNIQAYSFVTVHCLNFIIFWCVTLKLLFFSFVPLLAPSPGDTTAINPSIETNVFIRPIPHLEMLACGWSKSCHVTYTKSQYCPHETLLPSWIFMTVGHYFPDLSVTRIVDILT